MNDNTPSSIEEPIVHAFDFETHRRNAVSCFLKKRDFYADLASVVQRILEESLRFKDVRISSVEGRVKSISSFEKKASLSASSDPERPKYPHPLTQITDLAGVRVITFFLAP